ncbi:MAG: serine/threonine protein phosphatase 1 [Phycisphaerales bacterium]|jgi:serine/threonine protein phosphatase 1|nr:serine/threonine protein phosphatase 1 [Phycisphaerales bacterium]
MRWVIGDIHGMIRPLEALLRAIERHDDAPQLLFVGDFVNRGPDSRAVIDLLMSLKNAQCVRGNHDDVFDQVLCGQSYAGKPGEEQRVMAFNWFMQHGLDKTFLSYGVTPSELSRAAQRAKDSTLDELAESVPTPHRKFIRELPMAIEGGDFFVAHAKWDVYTGVDDPPISQRLQQAEMTRYMLLWGRYRADEIQYDKPWQRTGYFGHTPVDSYSDGDELVPVAGPHIVLLDTAAALVPHGRLTAFCHEKQSYLQADAQGKLVPV